ncbi:hypothetical protein ARMSODRAFT_1011568 [Armillaria solidipes]|uniref:Uncharacterized protein n=1 Tax=Armillaria solidipes TaxID=1076256 RepID=A0A2H3C346_9AGAR|nr:hypothetical protein ARMSODRAFT_1011568 [Armillaria solidipes]
MATLPRSSDEFLPRQEPECNVTLGPSNVPKTPPLLERPSTAAEEHGRDLWSCYHSPSPPPPLRATSTSQNTGTPSAMSQDGGCQYPGTPSKIRGSSSMTTSIRPCLVANWPFPQPSQRKSESESTTLCPHPLPLLIPDETAIPSTLMAMTTSGLHSPLSTDNSSAPTAPRPGSYEDATSRLASTLEVTTKSQWTGIWLYTEETQSPKQDTRRQSPQGSSPIESGDYTLLDPVYIYEDNTASDSHRNNAIWRSPYMPSPYDRPMDQTWMESTYNDFDHFHYGKGTFRGYTPDP